MEHVQDLPYRMGRPGPFALSNAGNPTVEREKPSSFILKRASTHPLRPSRRCPATPLMMKPTAAWRLLCAKTGGSISLGTFYRWIRDGRVCTIRMGKRIMVPVQMLNQVIEKCLNGEDLF